MLFYTLLFIVYSIPVDAGNIIFSSPTPGTIISAGNALIVSWDITVDSGDLTLESASGNSVSPKLLTSGLDGKSFTWTPTESDLSSFAGSGTVLRLLDRKDSARTGVSGTFNVGSPQKAPISSTPVVVQPTVPIASTLPAPQPTPIIINTIITTDPKPSTPSPTPTPTSEPPKSLTPDSASLPTTNNDPTTLISSTFSSSRTPDISSTDPQTPLTASSTRISSDPSTNSQPPTSIVTVAGLSPQPKTTPIDPPTPPAPQTLTTPIKTAIAVTSIFSIFFLVIVVFYFGKRTVKNNPPSDAHSQKNIQSFLRRATSRPWGLKPELDSESSQILELAAIKEKEVFEIEGKRLSGRKRSIAELQGAWEGVELEDTSQREGGRDFVGV